MLHLMKLEMKKFDLKKQFIGVLIATVIIFALMTLMSVASKMEQEMFLNDFAQFMDFGMIIIRVTFTIFTGTLIARMIIGEFHDKTMQLMFTYPISRKKLMQAKLTIILLFCLISVLISSLLIALAATALNPIMHLIPTTASFSTYVQMLPEIFFSSIACAGISLIPLFFGMRKKSVAITNTAASIIAIVINGTFGGGNGGEPVGMFNFILVPIALCLIGLVIAYLSYYKIDKQDI